MKYVSLYLLMMRPDQRRVRYDKSEQLVAARGCAISFRMPMCLGRVLLVMLEVLSTKVMYGILVPMNTPLLHLREARDLIT